ncbi:SEC-C metal-binding domain-containing protein [Pinirhizobacter soli]|uniref:SEC-C metal-binding domain-containing protein n=1 Tax=Pinirhizobacter soli TaxID=2786953 RepID=UPI003CE50C6A
MPVFRFPDELRAEATAYASSIGLSVNALVCVALRDYLDARKGLQPGRQGVGVEAPQTHLSGAKAFAAVDAIAGPKRTKAGPGIDPLQVPKVGVNDPCPCGSGQKYKRCHGKP